MRIKAIAESILDKRVIKYLKYNTFTATHYGFMCKFDEENDYGINLIDCEIDLVVDYLKSSDTYVIKKIEHRIREACGKCMPEYIVYFFLYHESWHWLEFLESGLSARDYCRTIDLDSYDGKLKVLRDQLNVKEDQTIRDEYNWVYRSTPYEKRADDYALNQLIKYLNETMML